MEPFKTFTALMAPLNRVNVDTDAIIPKQYLRGTAKTGLGVGLFCDWRYLEADESRENPEFVLNLPRYRNAGVLVAGDNFGCGSSREHAPWALMDYGFRAVVSTSFADIFYNNSVKNGLLLAVVSPSDLAALMDEVEQGRGITLEVDLENQRLSTSTGHAYPFTISDQARESLLTGMDEIDQTLQRLEKILRFEERSRERFPWLD